LVPPGLDRYEEQSDVQRSVKPAPFANSHGSGAFFIVDVTIPERTLARNFLGPFALTTRLLSLLSQSGAARIVKVVSSAFEMWTRDPFDDLNAQER
jgi:hypothetical protein